MLLHKAWWLTIVLSLAVPACAKGEDDDGDRCGEEDDDGHHGKEHDDDDVERVPAQAEVEDGSGGGGGSGGAVQ